MIIFCIKFVKTLEFVGSDLSQIMFEYLWTTGTGFLSTRQLFRHQLITLRYERNSWANLKRCSKNKGYLMELVFSFLFHYRKWQVSICHHFFLENYNKNGFNFLQTTVLKGVHPKHPKVSMKAVLEFEKRKPYRESVQFFNVLFRRIMTVLGKFELNRSYFDPDIKHNLPQYKCVLC